MPRHRFVAGVFPPPLLFLCAFLLALTGDGAAAEGAFHGTLVLTDADDVVVYSLPVEAGDRFAVVFTHSLALSRVEEVYEVMTDGEFRLRETTYADFGAGLPHEETPGLRMEFGDGRIRLSGYDVAFREVWLRIGHIANHRLLTPRGEEIRLADLRPPGKAVRIHIQ